MEQRLINDTLERIRLALESGHVDEAITALTSLHPADQAEAFNNLDEDDQAEVLPRLDAEDAAELLEQLDDEDAAEASSILTADRLADVLDEMEPDDAADVLGELSPDRVATVMSQMDDEQKEDVTKLLEYDDDTAGGLMTPDVPFLRRQWTCQQAIDHLRQLHPDTESPYYLYVVDRVGKLIGVVGLRDLIIADPNSTVEDVMRRNITSVREGTDQEEVARIFSKYSLLALPVVDAEDHLIGVIHQDDIVDVVEEEATEDLQKIGGSEALDEPYMLISFWRMIRKRVGWLIILFISEMLTATAMGFFEAEIGRAVVLAIFVPLIISSGGNSGSQAATLVIRAMALGEVKLRDWWRVMRRELLSGLTLGTILGTIGFLRIAFWAFIFKSYGEHWYLIGLTVGLSLIGIVLWGTLTGSMLPILLRRLGLDPATSSAPFVATLVDVTGLIIYFTVAGAVLRGTLL